MAREKFPDIFCVTISNYFQQSSSWSGEVVWGSHGSDCDLNFLVNSKLNLIFPTSLPKKYLIPLAAEYSFHPHPLKRWAQSTYIFLALSPILRYFFCHEKLHITNKTCIPHNICILPGNHSIRLIDIDKSECVVIKKEGFSDDKIKNAALTRLSYSNLPGPKILFYDKENSWYLEERIFGLPINRCEQPHAINISLSATKRFLKNMYQKTSNSVNAAVYIEQKFNEIDIAISSLPKCYEQADAAYLRNIKTKLFNLVTNIIENKFFISIAYSHGDLQDANILVPSFNDTRKVFIIDWEYAGVRCQHYDWFVYGLKSRTPKGLANRITKLINTNYHLRTQIDWYNFSGIYSHELKVLIYLFLIEDFLFRLDDTNIPNLPQKSEGFLTFVDELGLLLK
jgi:hypothetical protein